MAEIALAQTKIRTRRSVTIGLISIIIGAVILFMSRGTSGQSSTFVLTSQRAGINISAPDLVLPTNVTLILFGVLAALGGVWELEIGRAHV